MKTFIVLISILCFGSTLMAQIHSKSWNAIEAVIDQGNINDYGFIIYDTTGNSFLNNEKAILNFFLFKKIQNKRIKNLPFENSPNNQPCNDEIFNLDTVLAHSLLKIADYNIYNNIKSIINDTLGIDVSKYETVDYNISESLSYLVLQKHNGINYYNGLTFSDIIYYGNYGFQLVKIYQLNKDKRRPIYWKLIVTQKSKKGINLIEVISSDPMN